MNKGVTIEQRGAVTLHLLALLPTQAETMVECSFRAAMTRQAMVSHIAAALCIDMAQLYFFPDANALPGEIHSHDLCKYHSLRLS
jgi:hypothetical protein